MNAACRWTLGEPTAPASQQHALHERPTTANVLEVTVYTLFPPLVTGHAWCGAGAAGQRTRARGPGSPRHRAYVGALIMERRSSDRESLHRLASRQQRAAWLVGYWFQCPHSHLTRERCGREVDPPRYARGRQGYFS